MPILIILLNNLKKIDLLPYYKHVYDSSNEHAVFCLTSRIQAILLDLGGAFLLFPLRKFHNTYNDSGQMIWTKELFRHSKHGIIFDGNLFYIFNSAKKLNLFKWAKLMKAPFQILLNVYVPPMYDTLGWFWYFILCSGFNFIGIKKILLF